MNWLILATVAYFLNALVSVNDKILVSKKIPDPFVYCFFEGLLSVTVLVFAPFGFFLPSWPILGVALLSGVIFLFALASLFAALYRDEASRVVTVIGGLTPILIFLFAFLFLGEKLVSRQISAFIFLIIGGVLVSLTREKTGYKIKGLKLAILAAFLFAVSSVLTKFVFLHQPFFNGFIWFRLGSFLATFLFLVPASLRKKIFKMSKETKEGISLFFVGNKALAGLSFILLNAAVFKGSVTLVNGLGGCQYVFLFILALLFSQKFPQLLKEKISPGILIQKILAIFLIAVGLLILWLH